MPRAFATPRYSFRPHIVPDSAHPLVALVFEEANRQKVSLKKLGHMANVSHHTIDQWRYRHEPKLHYVVRCLDALGFNLEAVQRKVPTEDASLSSIPWDVWNALLKPNMPTTHAKRSCLSCGTAFPSDHAGNRICKHCRASKSWRAA